MTARVRLPAIVDARTALALSAEISGTNGEGAFQVDCSELSVVTPFALLLLVAAIQRRSTGARFEVIGASEIGYLAHMGFWRAVGVPAGRGTASATGSESHLPITFIALDELEAQARADGQVVQVAIERRSRELARQLLQSDRGPAYKFVQFGLQEVMRNVAEHSAARRFAIAAQYWPQRRQAEIAILDGGIGIHASLKKNPRLAVGSERHAIELALLPGVSCSPMAYRGPTDDPWVNAGFGLYMCSAVSRRHGRFVVASGQIAIVLEGREKSDAICACAGTAVGMTVSTDVSNLEEEDIRAIIRKGEAQAIEGQGVTPSEKAASRALLLG